MAFDLLLENCNAATMAGDVPYGAIEDAAIGISGEKIAWVGPRQEAGPAKARIDCGSRVPPTRKSPRPGAASSRR